MIYTVSSVTITFTIQAGCTVEIKSHDLRIQKRQPEVEASVTLDNRD